MNKHTPRPSDVMAYFDLSDEQWDILPNSVVDRLTEIYMKETAAPAMYEALSHAAMSNHHPACKCKGEYSANPERYCTCHVQKAKAALAQAEGKL